MVNRELCLVLLSGGLDSAVTAAWCRQQGYRVAGMSFDYGQRHLLELDCARQLAVSLRLEEHLIVPLPLGAFGGSSLTDSALAVHKEAPQTPVDSTMIPETYVPLRNLLFLSVAAAWCEARGSHHLAIGVNAVDYSGYPDCRPRFIELFRETANAASKRVAEDGEKLVILTPLLDLPKERIVQMGVELDIPFAETNSCYDPEQDGSPCHGCDSCRIREQAFASLGIPDPRVARFATQA